jgi:CubicO group peptidase (beta-lactamase class C family)
MPAPPPPDPDRLDALAEAAFGPVAEAVASGAVPGAALGLITADGARAVRVAGMAQVEPVRRPAARGTLWDLASLTKVLLTTPAVLGPVGEGRLDPDAPIAEALPDLNQVTPDAPVRRATARQLLAHAGGLPAWHPIYTYGSDPATLEAFVMQRRWPEGPPVYSDIGFILLGILAERVGGLALSDRVPGPGLTVRPAADLAAATEYCPWRRRMIVGEVHDENAFALGGIAGHAGLFGTVDGVLEAARGWLDGSVLPDRALVAAAFEAQAGQQTRGLGWQRTHAGWSGGAGHGPRTVGHLGFTGTGLWLDPDRGLAWCLLTNRVHPTRHRESGIMALRRAVGTAVAAG